MYSKNLLKTHDYSNYLASLFSPNLAAIWAISAFNIELATIQDTCLNVDIAKSRFHWWNTVLDSVYSQKPPNHPVAQELASAVAANNLSKTWFLRILNERRIHLDRTSFPSIKSLEDYSENTCSSLLYLHLEALGIKNIKADHAASHAGKAIGIATILRATPRNLQKGAIFLPLDILSKHSVVAENVIRHGNSPALSDAVYEIAVRANDQTITAKSFVKDAPQHCVPALLPLVFEFDLDTRTALSR
jgi:NADH dehydrogenase [ubiquinone] 1 alpha subcomplex assembly factor 6